MNVPINKIYKKYTYIKQKANGPHCSPEKNSLIQWTNMIIIMLIERRKNPLFSLWELNGSSFEQAQGCIVPSLVEIGPVVLEKMMKMWKVYDNEDRQRTNFDQKSSLQPSAQVS